MKNKSFRFSVSPLFVLLGAVMAYQAQFFSFISYSVAVVLHEFAHAEVSQRLGYTLNRLRLNPYGASLEGNFDAIKPKDEITIALAGPIFSILLAVPAVAMWWLLPNSYVFSMQFVDANLVIALFNLLPIFPLDGGRVLLGALSKKHPRAKAYKMVRTLGLIFSFIMIGLFALSLYSKINFSLGITAIFMLLSSLFPDKNSYYERLYSMSFRSERIKRGLTVREIMIDTDFTLIKLHKMLNGAYFTRFTVVDKNLTPLYQLTEADLEQISTTHPPKTKLNELTKPNTK